MCQAQVTQVDIPYEDIYLQNDGVFKKHEEGDYKIADYMAIKKIYLNIDTSDIVAEIAYYALRRPMLITIPRTDYMNVLKLINYAGKGLDIMKDNVEDIVRHFRNQEEIAPIEHQHSKIGFGYYEDKEVYKLYNSIGIESIYCGQYDLKPKGSKDVYYQMLYDHVIGHAPLELILITALSATIIGYIGEDLSLDTLIMHLKGNSTTGKTTAIRLGISAFGYADTKHNGLVGTYNATANALIKQLTGIRGVPFAFDELSMTQTKDLTNLIYTIANGTDKARLSPSAELKERGNWHTAVFSTGEKSLLASAKQNAGVQNRVIELEDIVYTKDADNAIVISNVIQNNYGHLAYDFVEYLLGKGKDYFIKQHQNCYQGMLKIFKQSRIVDSFTERRAKNFAVIFLTGKQLEKVIGKSFDWQGIINILIETEKKALLKRNFDKVAIDYIKQFVNIHISKFIIFGKQEKNSGSYWGKIKKIPGGIELEMLPIKFKEMLKQGGFEDETVVLKELKRNGLLNCEKDRYTRKRRTPTGIITEVYVIKILTSTKGNVKTGK